MFPLIYPLIVGICYNANTLCTVHYFVSMSLKLTAPTSSPIFVRFQVSSVHPQTEWRSEIEIPGYIVLPNPLFIPRPHGAPVFHQCTSLILKGRSLFWEKQKYVQIFTFWRNALKYSSAVSLYHLLFMTFMGRHTVTLHLSNIQFPSLYILRLCTKWWLNFAVLSSEMG